VAKQQSITSEYGNNFIFNPISQALTLAKGQNMPLESVFQRKSGRATSAISAREET